MINFQNKSFFIQQSILLWNNEKKVHVVTKKDKKKL